MNNIKRIEEVIKDCVFSTDDGTKRYLWEECVDEKDTDLIIIINKILNLVNNDKNLEDLEISILIKKIK